MIELKEIKKDIKKPKNYTKDEIELILSETIIIDCGNGYSIIEKINKEAD